MAPFSPTTGPRASTIVPPYVHGPSGVSPYAYAKVLLDALSPYSPSLVFLLYTSTYLSSTLRREEASKNLNMLPAGASLLLPIISVMMEVPGFTVLIVDGSSSAAYDLWNPQYPYTLPSSSTNAAGSNPKMPVVCVWLLPSFQLMTSNGPSGLLDLATMVDRPLPWLFGYK
ncbi:hypothetical protein D3C75_439420 [compost metagenome]